MLDGFALHEIIRDDAGKPVDYRFLAVNPAFESLTGLKAKKIVGKRVLEVIPGMEQHWIDTYGQVTLTGQPTHFENHSVELKRYYKVTAFRPAPGQFACIFADFTERKLAEEALRESEEMIRGIVEASQDWIWSIDLGGVHTYSNPAVKRILGYKPDDLVGKPSLNLMHKDDRSGIEAKLPEWIAKKCGWRDLPIRWRHKNGDWRLLESSAVPILNAAEERVGFRGVDRDITERSQLEEQLRQSQKMEAVGQLASGVAHDFNNLLQAIVGYGEIALEEAAPGGLVREGLDEIMSAAGRATVLIRQLLAFSRRQVLELESLDLNRVVDDLARMIRRVIGEHITLNVRSVSALEAVQADRGQLEQVLMNLCVNARDAMPGGGGFEPMMFLNAEGEPAGLYADPWPRWSEKTGVAVELRLMDWAATIPALRAGEVDAVDGVTPTPARAEFLDFSASYTELPTYIYFHESLGGVQSLGDLAGFPVGVIKGSHVEDFLQKEAREVRPVPYVSYEVMVQAAIAGRP